MNFKEYVELAMRTNQEGRTFKDNILNGILGLNGELTEFALCEDIEDTKDELSDLYWYVALMFNTMECEVIEGVEYSTYPSVVLGGLSDYFKKHFFQGHELDRDFVATKLSELKLTLDQMCKIAELRPEDVMEHNINKLKKRFPEGFSCEKSINRIENQAS